MSFFKDYYAFGFTSALLESIPFIGLVFSITNRIGAAMCVILFISVRS
jgi:hypothetical protein